MVSNQFGEICFHALYGFHWTADESVLASALWILEVAGRFLMLVGSFSSVLWELGVKGKARNLWCSKLWSNSQTNSFMLTIWEDVWERDEFNWASCFTSNYSSSWTYSSASAFESLSILLHSFLTYFLILANQMSSFLFFIDVTPYIGFQRSSLFFS